MSSKGDTDQRREGYSDPVGTGSRISHLTREGTEGEGVVPRRFEG